MTCTYHLWSEVSKTGKLTVRHQDGSMREPDDSYDPPFEEQRQYPTCALNVADSGEKTTYEIADYMGIFRQRVEQIEQNSFDKLRKRLKVIYNDYKQV